MTRYILGRLGGLLFAFLVVSIITFSLMHAVPGEVAKSEEPLMTVGDLSVLWLWADLYERDLASVADQNPGSLQARNSNAHDKDLGCRHCAGGSHHHRERHHHRSRGPDRDHSGRQAAVLRVFLQVFQ